MIFCVLSVYNGFADWLIVRFLSCFIRIVFVVPWKFVSSVIFYEKTESASLFVSQRVFCRNRCMCIVHPFFNLGVRCAEG